MIQVTYQKRDGNIIHRPRNTILPYKVGDTTSMGWKVLNIEYEYKNKYYPEYEYNVLIAKNRKRYVKIRETRDRILKEFKTLLYYFIVIIMYHYIKILLGI